MDSAYIKALRDKYKNAIAKAKEREKIKLNTLYKDMALAIVQKAQNDSEFKKCCIDDESIAKAFVPLLEMYLPQDSKETTPKQEKE